MRKTDDELRDKLSRKSASVKKLKVFFVLLLILLVLVIISLFVTKTEEVISDVPTNENGDEIVSTFMLNGVRFDLPCPAMEVPEEDSTFDDKTEDMGTFDAREYAVAKSDLTYKVIVGYMNELPPDSEEFKATEDFFIRNFEGLKVTGETKVSKGMHYVLRSESHTLTAYDFFVFESGTVLFGIHEGGLGGPRVTGLNGKHTNFLDEAQELYNEIGQNVDVEDAYSKWDENLNWVEVFDTFLKGEKTRLNRIIYGVTETEVQNWKINGKIHDTDGLAITLTALNLLDESDDEHSKLAVGLKIDNTAIKGAENQGYLMGNSIKIGLTNSKDVDEADVTWLEDGVSMVVGDIRFAPVHEGESVKGYALFNLPDNWDEYQYYVIRYYKTIEAERVGDELSTYIQGVDEIPYLAALTLV